MAKKFLGPLQIQVFNRATGVYEPFLNITPTAQIARAIAHGLPWRICKSDRPLKPEVKNRYRLYQYGEPYLGKS